MNNQKVNDIFIVLGAVWIIVGFIIFQGSTYLLLGFIFLILGLIGTLGRKKKNEKQENE